jgi:hypothetical protein
MTDEAGTFLAGAMIVDGRGDSCQQEGAKGKESQEEDSHTCFAEPNYHCSNYTRRVSGTLGHVFRPGARNLSGRWRLAKYCRSCIAYAPGSNSFFSAASLG